LAKRFDTRRHSYIDIHGFIPGSVLIQKSGKERHTYRIGQNLHWYKWPDRGSGFFHFCYRS